MHWRVVWSLIFIVFGVYLVKAEVQEDHAHKGVAREVHMDEEEDDDVGGVVSSQKTVRERTQKPLKKTVREGTPVHQQEKARERTQGP